MEPKITTEQHYKITLTGGSTYYGRTTLPGNDRYNQHRSDVKAGRHSSLQESYDKYGYDGWVHEWLGWETGDIDYHNQIEYGYVQADPKALNIRKGYWAILSEDLLERDRMYQQQKKVNQTPEELEESLRKAREYDQRKRDNMTPEEKEEHRRKQREYEQRKRASWTPEELEEYRRKDKEYKQRKRDEKKRSGDNK